MTNTVDAPFEEKVYMVSSPRDVINLFREAININLGKAQPLFEQYETAEDINLRHDIGEQIRRVTNELTRNTILVQDRAANLWPTAAEAIDVAQSFNDKEQERNFITFWAHALADHASRNPPQR